MGKGYIKAMGGPEGPHTLACEWIGTRLAQWFGLSTFDFALIEVTEADEIPFHSGAKAQTGPAFITRAESGEPWSGAVRQLRRLVNPQDISRLVVFDTWTLNCDRHSVPPAGNPGRPRLNRNNVFLSQEAPKGRLLLKAMDHTHCFTCGKPLSRHVGTINTITDPRVFGLFREFRQYLDRDQVQKAMADLRNLERKVVLGMTNDIPRQWDVAPEALAALRDLIAGRAAYVAKTIEDALWPQGGFGFDGPAATEPTT
jgi:hypothetical protein